MELKKRVDFIIKALEEKYPQAKCSLEAASPLNLLIATRLSAQCTDSRVNMVTPALFFRFPNAKSFAQADVLEIEKLIFSCGFYKTKAKNIKDLCRMLIDEFECKVPDTIEDLIRLPGVGRKTANLIIGDIYGKPSIVVDTHCIRITNRLGLVQSENPLIIEKRLKEIIPPQKSTDFCHRVVWHGRETCPAHKPKCSICPLTPVCPSANINM
jgi:endonuclease-3